MTQPNPPRTSAVWYGTLLRAHAALPEANLAQLAAQLGFQRQAKQPNNPPQPSPTPISHNAQSTPRPTPPPALDQRRYHPLYVTQYQPQQPPAPVPPTTPEPLESIADLLQRGAEGPPLASEPLCRNAPLHTWLRGQYRTQRPGHRLDMPRIIRHIAQGRSLRHLPRQPRRHWPHTVHLWRSTRLALAPLQTDYARIERLLTHSNSR